MVLSWSAVTRLCVGERLCIAKVCDKHLCPMCPMIERRPDIVQAEVASSNLSSAIVQQ